MDLFSEVVKTVSSSPNTHASVSAGRFVICVWVCRAVCGRHCIMPVALGGSLLTQPGGHAWKPFQLVASSLCGPVSFSERADVMNPILYGGCEDEL